MKKEDVLLSVEEFANLELSELEKNRKHLRDVHLSWADGVFNNNKAIRFFLEQFMVVEDEPYVMKTMHWGFRLKDDPDRLYFFDYFWPERYDVFLRPEDVIESYVGGVDLSTKNLRKVLKILQARQAKYPRIFKPEEIEGEPELKIQFEKHRLDWSEGVLLLLPFLYIEDVICAWASKNKEVERLLGSRHHPFTKPLKRTMGGPIERYNSLKSEWEFCEGRAEFEVDIKIVEQARSYEQIQ